MPNPPVPVLETERLRLHGHAVPDFAACAAMWADPVVCRHLGRPSFTEEESWSRLLRYVGHWALLGFGYWAVEEKASGRFVGDVGFADYKRNMQSSLKEVPEIGWVLAAWAHGKGYATEAARAAIQWADTHLDARQTTCIISPGNLSSIHVAEKCGYRHLELTTYQGKPILVFVREGTGC